MRRNGETDGSWNQVKFTDWTAGFLPGCLWYLYEQNHDAYWLAEVVVAACEEENKFDFLYDLDLPLKDRVHKISTELYGASGVEWSETAEQKIQAFQNDPEIARMGTCMVKTHLSLSHNPDFKGAPTGWKLPIRDVLIYKGAGFVVPVAGDIKLLPGTGSHPGFRQIDITTETGKVTGLF